MIPPCGQHHLVQGLQRELAEVQSYIQARLQTDEPYLLNVNPAQVAEYQDELQHYVKQKQRQHQLRRPLHMSREAAPAVRATAPPAPRVACQEEPTPARVHTHTPAHSSRSFSHQPSASMRPAPPSDCMPSVVPKRLPGVEWLLALNHHEQQQQQQYHSQADRYATLPPTPCLVPAVPVMEPPSYPPLVDGFGFAAHPAMHHRTLKKQKTM